MIATTSEMFREFERRYGDKVPEARGDFTPYWEDGAGSSARETAMARNASDRLVYAETLFAMLNPRRYQAEDFYYAWRSVLLYNEHTWGANCSISKPDSDFTKAQWNIKAAFARDAMAWWPRLLAGALAGRGSPPGKVSAIDVLNAASWPRTDLVALPPQYALVGGVVKDAAGQVMPSQRIAGKGLAFLASDVPPLGAKRFFFEPGQPAAYPLGAAGAAAEGLTLRTARLRLAIDEKTGAIASFTVDGMPGDLVPGGRAGTERVSLRRRTRPQVAPAERQSQSHRRGGRSADRVPGRHGQRARLPPA